MAKKDKRKKKRPSSRPKAGPRNASRPKPAPKASAPSQTGPLTFSPDDPPASVDEALAQANQMVEQGMGDQAAAMLALMAEEHSQDADLLQALGKLYMNRQNFGAAAQVFRRLAEDILQDGQSYNALGMALTMAGDHQQAAQYMHRAVSLDPDNHTRLGNLGKVYMLLGNWHLAQVYLERAVAAAPEKDRWKHQEVLNTCVENARESEAYSSNPFREDEETQQTQENQQTAYTVQADGMSFSVPVGPDEPPAPAAQPRPPAQTRPQFLDQSVGLSLLAPTVPGESPAPAQARPTDPAQPQSLAKTARALNILFVQDSPCIRNYKLACALSQRGHRVTLAYGQHKLSQMYPGLSDDVYAECRRITSHPQLWDMSREYDLVHCHNEPDVLTVAAMAGKRPVIHDTHDLISLRAGGDANLAFFEGVANRGADGRVYTTPYQLNEAKRLYGVDGPSLVHYNYASAEDLPSRFLPKRSQEDGLFHMVYEGGIGQQGHRDFSDLFIALAQGGVVIHIYPTGYNPQLAQLFSSQPNIHYNQPLSPKQIMEEMTQFDAGIIPFNLQKGNKRFLDSTIANKLFEYLAAGLPVAASPLQSYVDYFQESPVGLTFKNAKQLLGSLDKLNEIAAATDFSTQVFTHESQVEALEQFYYQVIDSLK